MAQSARRAEVVSLGGLLLQVVFFGIILLVALWNTSYATFIAAFYLLGGLPIWLVILLIFHQEKLVRLEALEAEQIDRDRQALGAEAIFAEGQAGAAGLLVAQSRLEWMQKWLVPLFGLITSLYLIATGLSLWKWYLVYPIGVDEWPDVTNASVSMVFVGGVAFVSFLFSRYTVGMARIGGPWRLLRAGGSYLTGNALICGLTAIMLGFVASEKEVPEQVLAKIIPIVMCVIGAEIILNLLLDIYRPRRPGELPRAAIDSRLLGLVSEPGGIARTIAEAVNYQFGFEVSKTWFYQLLQRWAVVLAGAAAAIILLMTCLVLVEPGEQAVVERFGSPIGLNRDSRSIETLGPGLHLKLPWPIEDVRRYRVDRIQTVWLGFGPWKRRTIPKVEEEPNLILWTSGVHGPGEELDFILPVRARTGEGAPPATRPAATQEAGGEGMRTPAVNLLRLDLPIFYRISNLYQYAFSYANPETLIESAAYGVLVKYVASRDLDDMLAVERTKAVNDLTRLIQTRCDELGVGVKITSVGLQNIHPPQAVAKEFEAYLNAKYEAKTAVEEAEGQANKLLGETAGSRRLAEQLAAAIVRLQKLEAEKAPEPQRKKTSEEIDRLFGGQGGGEGVSGLAYERVAAAKADRWLTENKARGQVGAFQKEQDAYRAAPRLFKVWQYTDAMIRGLQDAEKYVVGRDGQVFLRYDSQERENVRLEDIDYNVPPG